MTLNSLIHPSIHLQWTDSAQVLGLLTLGSFCHLTVVVTSCHSTNTTVGWQHMEESYNKRIIFFWSPTTYQHMEESQSDYFSKHVSKSSQSLLSNIPLWIQVAMEHKESHMIWCKSKSHPHPLCRPLCRFQEAVPVQDSMLALHRKYLDNQHLVMIEKEYFVLLL